MIVVSACFRTETAWIPKLPDVRVVQTPMGEAAAGALERLLPDVPALILSTGFCGGLVPTLHSGKLVLAEAIHQNGEMIPVEPALFTQAKEALRAARLDFVCGPIRSSDRVLQTQEEKHRLQTNGAIAVDMESGPLARWAQKKQIRFLSIRAVLDPVDQELPLTMKTSLIRSILQHPLTTLRLARLSVQAGRIIGRAIPVLVSGFEGGAG
ncbi:MAG TPA: hypothetical protein VMX15_02995 [Candidatus Heimdallarchaeota archaeon]|nr:hypothetical protein [Candidatus Heimdallarchaeota archaeon]